MKNVTFRHHCELIIPPNSPYSTLRTELAGPVNGQSSYQIIANQSKCPPGLNVHEFMAFQSLLSGKSRRWPQILVELGSTNLNFSAEATTFLMSHLVLETGPSDHDDMLGRVHRIFRDGTFTRALLDQLRQRLDGMTSNWRETNSMETIITILLRSLSLAPNILDETHQLLEKARNITRKWISLLRLEITAVHDADTSRNYSYYILWAALLCKRTITIFGESSKAFESEDLECFIECSVALQDNLVGNPEMLPLLLRNAIVRDLKMVYQMRFIFRDALTLNPDSLVSAINTVWPGSEGGQPRTFSHTKFLPEPHTWWIQALVDPTPETIQQIVHFHLLEGHLLVNEQPVGKLPTEYRKSLVLQELFGNQSLLTYPSNLPGMTYMLAITPNRHEVHLGTFLIPLVR